MEFKNDRLKTKFTLPDPFTARHHEAWEGRRFEVMQAGAKANLTVNWLSATAVIQDWESELIPDIETTLEAALALGGPQLAVMSWVGTVVFGHIVGLLTVPKAPSEPPPSAQSKKK